MRNPPNSDKRSQGRTKVKRYYSMFTDKKTHYCQGVSPSNEYPGLSFRIDWFDLLAVLGTLKCSIPGLGRFPGGGQGNPLQYSCLKSPGQRSLGLAGYSPWGHKELDMTERLNTALPSLWFNSHIYM